MKIKGTNLECFFQEVDAKVRLALNKNLSISKHVSKQSYHKSRLPEATSFDSTLLNKKSLNQLKSFSSNQDPEVQTTRRQSSRQTKAKSISPTKRSKSSIRCQKPPVSPTKPQKNYKSNKKNPSQCSNLNRKSADLSKICLKLKQIKLIKLEKQKLSKSPSKLKQKLYDS